MRKPVSQRTIGIGLVCAHALLAASLAIALADLSPPEEAEFVLLLAVAIGQTGLIGLWAGFARAPTSRRLTAAIIGGGAICVNFVVAIETSQGRRDAEEWIAASAFTLAPLVSIGILGVVLRKRGWFVERLSQDEANPSARAAQFSLFHLFAITSVAAVLFALVRQLRAQSPGPHTTPWEYCLFAAFNALVFVLHTQICLWSALGAGRLISRLGGLLFSTALAGAVYGFALGGRQNDVQHSFELMSAYSIMTVGTLLVLRRFGYRLTRQAPADK